MSRNFTAPICFIDRDDEISSTREASSLEEVDASVGLTFSQAREKIAAQFKESVALLSSHICVDNSSNDYFTLIFISPLLVSAFELLFLMVIMRYCSCYVDDGRLPWP